MYANTGDLQRLNAVRIEFPYFESWLSIFRPFDYFIKKHL